MNKLSIRAMHLSGKRVLTRVDFNVPQDDDLNITDDTRIKTVLPTIHHILGGRGKLVLMSHLGRPKGAKVDKLKMDPVALRLQHLLGKPVKKLDDCIGAEVTKAVSKMNDGDVILLENLRFYKEEEANDDGFSQQLAALGDLYINDAFACSHRAHASVVGVTKYLKAGVGLLLAREIDYLSRLIGQPDKPYVAIVGGAKTSDKIMMLENLLDKLDCLLIGGGMAYTFLKAQGKAIGNSRCEDDKLTMASEILKKAQAKNVKVVLPTDHLIADKHQLPARIKLQEDGIPDGWMGVDIGPKSIEQFKQCLTDAKTIVWNGPVGVFEIDKFAQGSKAIAQTIANLKGVTTIVGGGDTAAAAKKFKVDNAMSHVSTGGGATLEFLEGKELPGIAALSNP